MNILETMTVLDYINLVIGIIAVILGILQCITKKCIGIVKIDRYTAESAAKFTKISSVIYILGGIIITAFPLIVNYINLKDFGFSLSTELSSWIVIGFAAVVIIVQSSILRKNDAGGPVCRSAPLSLRDTSPNRGESTPVKEFLCNLTA